MKNDTRRLLNSYFSQQAKLNGIDTSTILGGGKFSVDPSVQQKLEDRNQEDDSFLGKINIVGVDEQEGEKLWLGISGPLASTNTSTTERRQPRSVHTLDDQRYRCEQTNTDTYIAYAQLDAWAKFPDFQARISNQIAKRKRLDRIMIGFNGTSRAAKSDFGQNPLLQDVNIGFLEQYRRHAPQRVLSDITITRRDDTGKVIAKGDYGNLDALIQDARTSLLDPWYIDDPDLVVIVGRHLINDREFPLVNTISPANPNTEELAGQLLLKQGLIGGVPYGIVPFVPDGTMLLTTYSNLSIYWQLSSARRLYRDEPEYNRLATYSSINDAYVIEDYGLGCLIEGITWAGSTSEQ
ncbi:phage major capsid protein, P2 family [Serratia marcescens]|uniref:phage major capsid protein, P2 family n=1 Tax=Serratia marcescens TaxID=615 RepID=UPI0024C4E5C3|nr:phage major capsid protein, P2 family [Serratia marcescens]MDK1707020.1 phage major capsid protein, P2 family [Serratia marcescens]